MVLVVKGLRRLLRPRLSDESTGTWLRGSRADPHGGHGRLETAAPFREKGRAESAAPATKKQGQRQGFTVPFRAWHRLRHRAGLHRRRHNLRECRLPQRRFYRKG